MFESLFNKEYLHCRELSSGIHFFHNEIRACCANVRGPVFYSDYKGEVPVDFDYIYKKRIKYIKEFNTVLNKKNCPECCKNCFETEYLMNQKKIEIPENIIDKVLIQNSMACNAKCIYCCHEQYGNAFNYRVVPIIKTMIEKNILSKQALIYMSGGEITISPEFEDLMSLLTDYVESQIEILTSGIKYSESINKAFIKDKVRLVISLDSACAETYKTIKQVDCFDRVIDNIKTYIASSDNAKQNIVLKYILLDNLNDNENEITGFLENVKTLGIKNVRMDIDNVKYSMRNDTKVPENFYRLIKLFNDSAASAGLNVLSNDMITSILNHKK